jgi:hypothetical protein
MKNRFISILLFLTLIPLQAYGGVDISNGLLDTPSAYVLDNTVFAIGVSMTALPYGDEEFAEAFRKRDTGD